MTNEDQSLEQKLVVSKARNYDLNTSNVGNRAGPQAVIDISDVSTTETSSQKYKQNSQREKTKSRWGWNSE